ncbi:6756_t:CDS:1 [Funneliformis caledonium]|uniref:ER membrane protein complex subunit 6 n=1 Tax=Funneliformis caledonium TaxID=1117310 RepID=A0A9N8VV62_9GLOM|nr:6756_t:CDS:1 [Funneliformis caledonium]
MASQSPQNQASLYVPENVVHNTKTITFIRSSMSAINGSAAGILGLTGYSGFIFYALTALFTSFLIWSVKTNTHPGIYFRNGSDVWTEGVFGGLFSYVLFWTLLYGIVHGTYKTIMVHLHKWFMANF